eukprot:5067701-Prymnesium_polylepis.3
MVSSRSEHRSAHLKVGGVGMLQGGAHGLVNAVRVPPLKRAQSAAPSAHPALESPTSARDAASQLGNWKLQLEHGQLFGNGLRVVSSDLDGSPAPEVTTSTKPDPDRERTPAGRLVRAPTS